MPRAYWTIVSGVVFLAACMPAEQAPPPTATPQAAQPSAAQPSPAPALPPGATILSCTPIEDRPPPPGQVSLLQPFSLVLDRDGRPLQFVGTALPVRIPFAVAKIEPANGPPEMRVGAMIHYAAKDTAHEMYSALAIMKDGTYRLGVMVKTPEQSTNGLVNAGHGTCVGKPA
jgi:hypothetical protein